MAGIKRRGRSKGPEYVWVRWNGNTPLTIPYGRVEITLKPAPIKNRLTQKQFDAITGGLDSKGRARGGPAALYWNATPPLLQEDSAAVGSDVVHEPKEGIGIRPSRRTLTREAENAELRERIKQLEAAALNRSPAADSELAELRRTVADLQRKVGSSAVASGPDVDPSKLTVAELADAIKDLDRGDLAQVLVAEINGSNRSSAVKLITKAIESSSAVKLASEG